MKAAGTDDEARASVHDAPRHELMQWAIFMGQLRKEGAKPIRVNPSRLPSEEFVETNLLVRNTAYGDWIALVYFIQCRSGSALDSVWV
jgi:hypothetical protein